MLILTVTACGPGARDEKSPRAVGAKTVLGRTLTAHHWCSAPTTGSDPTFVELDVRQNGQYIKLSYQLNGDNSLTRRGEERGTWAVVGDQFFTRTMRRAQTRQQVKVDAASDASSTARVTKRDANETCVSLGDAGGQVNETYCSCPPN